MGQLKNEIIPFLKADEIEKLIRQIAAEINHDFQNANEILFVCPLKGSVIFLADLVRHITLPVKVDFVHLISPKNESVRILKDVSENITGKHVFIIEEIIDAGRTLNFLKKHLKSSDPATLKIVSLLDKPSRREIALAPDYVGMTIDDRYVIGYGLDSEEVGRNYKDIYNFRQ